MPELLILKHTGETDLHTTSNTTRSIKMDEYSCEKNMPKQSNGKSASEQN